MFLRFAFMIFLGSLCSLPFVGFAQSTPTVPVVKSTPMPILKNKVDPHLLEAVKKSVDKGIHFLRNQQAKDGSYGHHVGLTAMTLLAFAESHRHYNEGDGPYISRAVEWLVAQAREDGSISGDATPTYNTALAIMALHALNPTKYKAFIERGQRFLTRFQSDEDQNYTPKDKYYGGIGYGGDERPDLSNLHYALEALKKTDYDPNSDVWKKAELFVKRCQNYTEEDEKDSLARPWATNDGGFIYEPGSSRAGGTQSYGAMTFAGLKSLIFTNRTNRNDNRVKAALNWIQNHYDFNSHPGMGTTAYYYYLQTAASALEAYGEPIIQGKEGKQYHWTSDLLTKVINLQQENGSWINENRKYWEGNPILVSARSIITVNHIFRTLSAAQSK
jgi:squalene-hopene/tetraprenyl-beta-curcumene cyclase